MQALLAAVLCLTLFSGCLDSEPGGPTDETAAEIPAPAPASDRSQVRIEENRDLLLVGASFDETWSFDVLDGASKADLMVRVVNTRGEPAAFVNQICATLRHGDMQVMQRGSCGGGTSFDLVGASAGVLLRMEELPVGAYSVNVKAQPQPNRLVMHAYVNYES